MSRFSAIVPAAALTLALALPVAAEEEMATTTISAIERGEAQGAVFLEGAALEQVEEEILFSDGTGVIRFDIAEDAGEGELPLFELIGIEGMVAGDEIEVSHWALLPIMKAAVIVPEERVIEVFRGWIIAFSSQAPAPTE